jgi:hypothetical protein
MSASSPFQTAHRAASLAALLLLALPGCQDAPTSTADGTEREAGPLIAPAALLQQGNSAILRVAFPADDPGPPFYSRVSPRPELLNQLLTDGAVVAIPFYRDPACVPDDFDHFDLFHPPSEAGPGAFACTPLVHGFYMIEQDAPFATLPRQVNTQGPAVFWFVDHAEFMSLTVDGTLPHHRLVSDFTSLRTGVASRFNEILRPRVDTGHQVTITARGTLDEGGTFGFSVNHHHDQVVSIVIRLD